MGPHPRTARAALLGALLALQPECGANHSAELLRLVPGLDPELASHLAGDDSERFQRYATTIGRGQVSRALYLVRTAPPTARIEEFVRVEGALAPYAQRLVGALSKDPKNQAEKRSYEAYRRRPARERLATVELIKEINAVDPSSPVESRAAALLRFIERCRPYADILNLGDLYASYAAMLPQLRRSEDIPRWLNLGLEATLEFGDYAMACQILGTLGSYYAGIGNTAAMACAWDSAAAYARRIDSWQEARILNFWGTYYRSRGQLAITRDLVLEAQDRCRQLGATDIELRFGLDALQFFASLECWELVGRGLTRAEMAYSDARPRLSRADAELEGTRLDVMRARHAAAIGRCGEARALALGAANRIEHWSLGPTRTAMVRLNAAQALRCCGDTEDARRLLELGLEQCTRTPVPELEDDYAIELAQTALDCGDLAVTESLLGRYSPKEGSQLAVRRAVLELRLVMLRGDRALAFDRLRAALHQLEALEARVGGSPEGYIVLAMNDNLRRAGHELLDDSPEAGYGFEMWWRTPAGRRSAPLGSRSAFVAGLVADARRAVGALGARGAIHCVYDVRDDGIVRFTASAGGITKDHIDFETETLRAAAHRVRSTLGQPASGVTPDISADLRRLGNALLPESVRRAGAPRLFLVTANDCLAQLPFEALDVGTRGYVPLAESTDLAWVRYWNVADTIPGDSALVVCQPRYSAGMLRRHTALNEALPASALEASDAARLLPLSRLLSGSAATKRNLVDRWQRARLLYIAGHFVQDTEIPYVMFVPMSATTDPPADSAYLEVGDVRAADLSRCQLVVLSGCASGASYLSGRVVTPSLADVFVDAGASAVVSTSWSVQDDDAARDMREFIRQYAGGENDPIGALGRARRAVAAENPGPRSWAGFAVTICRLPRFEPSPMAHANIQAGGGR